MNASQVEPAMTAPSEVAIRETAPSDYSVTEIVTREAFWNIYGPGCDEHYLLHAMRRGNDFVPELDFVAVRNDEVIGNIVCNRAVIVTDDFGTLSVLALGPVAVLPEFQGKGIGGRLVEEVKKSARRLGFPAILLFGDPEYYSRLGFVPAEDLEIRTADDMYADPLQVFELHDKALKGKSGRFEESDEYEIDEHAVAEFDKQFPPKEEVVGSPSQTRFQELLGARRPRIN